MDQHHFYTDNPKPAVKLTTHTQFIYLFSQFVYHPVSAMYYYPSSMAIL